jgi:hypothetical protein
MRGETMQKYVIERSMPGVGQLSAAELQAASQNSNKVLAELGPEIVWLTSFVTEDKIYCVYVAPDSDIIEEHARCAGLPADRITKVSAVIDPSTAG